MMAANIAINIVGDDIEGALRKLVGQAGDMRPAMRAISEAMLDSIEEALDSEANPETGAPWPTLAPSTILRRLAKGKWPGKMLQVSQGGLASSFAASAGSNYAQAGSNKPYAAIHHFGGQAGRGGRTTIPARPYAGLTPEHRQEVLDIIQRHLTG